MECADADFENPGSHGPIGLESGCAHRRPPNFFYYTRITKRESPLKSKLGAFFFPSGVSFCGFLPRYPFLRYFATGTWLDRVASWMFTFWFISEIKRAKRGSVMDGASTTPAMPLSVAALAALRSDLRPAARQSKLDAALSA